MLFHSRFRSRAWRFARGHATCGWGTSCWDPNIPPGGASWPLPLCDIDINKRASIARTVWIVFYFFIDHSHFLSSERRAQISLSNFTHLFGLFLLDFLQLLSGHFRIYKNIAIDYIRTVEIHGRFADVFGRFLHHRLQSGRQTDRLLLSGDLRIWRLSVYFFGYWGFMLFSTDAISPDLYKKVRRSVGDFFWSFFGGGPTTGYTGREQT